MRPTRTGSGGLAYTLLPTLAFLAMVPLVQFSTAHAAQATHTEAVTPTIHTVSYPSGFSFRHFEFEFTQDNVRLANAFPQRMQLDETAANFRYGQFEVFIPARYLKLPQNCTSNYIVRMPQTLDLSKQEHIQQKQQLYRSVHQVATGQRPKLKVVLEIHYQQGCNLFFREYRGQYIDYLGKTKTHSSD